MMGVYKYAQTVDVLTGDGNPNKGRALMFAVRNPRMLFQTHVHLFSV